MSAAGLGHSLGARRGKNRAATGSSHHALHTPPVVNAAFLPRTLALSAHFVLDEPSVEWAVARLPRLRHKYPESVCVAVVAEIFPHELVDEEVLVGEWGREQPVLRPFQGVKNLGSHLLCRRILCGSRGFGVWYTYSIPMPCTPLDNTYMKKKKSLELSL